MRGTVLGGAAAAALVLSAKLAIPFWPVPVTMQSWVVLVVGMVGGAVRGAAVVALYVLVGACGVPVFARPGAGLAYLAGPSGGYLLGFVLGAALVGALAERGQDRRVGGALVAMALGTAVVLLCGVGGLALQHGLAAAWERGALPFLPGAALKIVLGGLALPLLWRVVDRRSAG